MLFINRYLLKKLKIVKVVKNQVVNNSDSKSPR